MTIQEETESEYKAELKLWPNTDGKIYLEVGPTDNEDAPYYTGAITLTASDAKALIHELNRILKDMADYDDGHQPKINQASTEGKTTLSNQPSTSDQPSQQLTLSKVNWGK